MKKNKLLLMSCLLLTPIGSMCTAMTNCGEQKRPEISAACMGIYATDGDIKITPNGEISSVNLEYILDNETKWSNFNKSIDVLKGHNIRIRGNNSNGFTKEENKTIRFQISGNGIATVKGSILSLLDNGEKTATCPIGQYCFKELFAGSTAKLVISDEFLTLNITSLIPNCFEGMFKGCTGLTTLPKLPNVDTLASSCYKLMFYGCSEIKEIPENYLAAQTLSENCYESMFESCTNLSKVNSIDFATQLANNVYKNMFKNCTSLYITEDWIGKPVLSTVEVQGLSGVYDGMFDGCKGPFTSGTPTLNHSYNCYNKLDACINCTVKAGSSMKMTFDTEGTYTRPDVQFSTDGDNWESMFNEDGSSKEISFDQDCNVYFKGKNPTGFNLNVSNCTCFNLHGDWQIGGSIMGLLDDGEATITSIPSEGCFCWLFANAFTPIHYESKYNLNDGIKGISEDFLPARTLSVRCYEYLFHYCGYVKKEDGTFSLNYLTSIPKLPAVNLADYCYSRMFDYSVLNKSPELPAETLTQFCYLEMFTNAKIKELGLISAKNIGYRSCLRMFQNLSLQDSNKLFNKSGEGRTAFFACPSDASTADMDQMLSGITYGIEDTPVPGNTYYYGKA